MIPSLPFGGHQILRGYKYIILILLIILLNGCDSGLKITKIEIAQLPNKTVYKCNIDDALEIEGGKINIITADGHEEGVSMYSNNIKVEHNINFNCPGKYDVIIYYGKLTCKYVITVE